MSKTLRSEIDRLARTLWEGFADPDRLPTSKVEAIVTYVSNKLFPVADAINETNARRVCLDDLDRIQYAAEQFLEVYDGNFVTEEAATVQLATARTTLSGVSTLINRARLSQIVSEELTENHTRSSLKRLLEEPTLMPGDVEKLANDSVDVSLDSYFQKASETLDMTGAANKEKAETGEGEQNFSAADFASDIATLVDRANVLLDLEGTIARRAYNYVSEKHGPDAANNFKEVLQGNFSIYLEAQGDLEGERNASRPAAVGAGAGSGGEAAQGGGGGEGAP